MIIMRFKKMAETAIFLLFVLFCSPSWGDELSREIALGNKVASQIESNWSIVSDPVKVARVEMVFNRLLPYVSRSLPYEVKIVDLEMINAFCIPGGRIYVTTGLLDFVRSDGELAAILGHELAHADKNHVMIQAERSKRLSLATLAIIIASQGQAAAAMMAGIAQIAVTNGYSRDLEREADLLGVSMVWKAGYPPAASLTVMEGLAEDQMKRPYTDPGIFMSHPRIQERIEFIRQVIKDNRWPLSRKKALKSLIPSVEEDNGRFYLSLDRNVIWTSSDPESSELFYGISEVLERHLELETSPHDLEVVQVRGSETLVLSGRKVAQEPLPDGLSLMVLRDNIVKALTEAKRKNPVAEYLN
nr:M48 family metallopeptidase [uncultured Dethiosulfovibrio sp.]